MVEDVEALLCAAIQGDCLPLLHDLEGDKVTGRLAVTDSLAVHTRARRSLTKARDRPYTLPSRPRVPQAPFHAHVVVTTAAIALPRTHVRSHRDRREAVPRRGRHRAPGGAARYRARPVDHPGARAARRRRRRGDGRDADRGGRGRGGRGGRPRSGRQGHRVQVPAQGPAPGQEGPPAGPDPAAHRRHPVQWQERGGGRGEDTGRQEDRAPAAPGGSGPAGRGGRGLGGEAERQGAGRRGPGAGSRPAHPGEGLACRGGCAEGRSVRPRGRDPGGRHAGRRGPGSQAVPGEGAQAGTKDAAPRRPRTKKDD